jgi:hypothetical protein
VYSELVTFNALFCFDLRDFLFVMMQKNNIRA